MFLGMWFHKEVGISSVMVRCAARHQLPVQLGTVLGSKLLILPRENGSRVVARFAWGVQCFRKNESLGPHVASS